MDKTFLGSRIETLLPGIESLPINRVEILDDNGDVLAKAQSSSIANGKTLSVVNPDGTEAMAKSILSKTEGYIQRSYEGRNALLDPAVELGDAVTVGGIYSVIAEQNLQFDALYRADISAPAADEIDDEYPYKSSTQRQIERNMAKTRSLITKTSEEINLKIEGLDDQYTSLKVTLDGVTVSDASGTTKIKGSSIETSTLKVSSANITGTLTIGQLPDSVAETSDIPTNVSELTNDSGYQTRSGVVSIVNGTVTADYIYALGIEANSIRGSEIAIKNGDGDTVGGITTVGTTSGYGLGITSINGGVRIDASTRSNIFLNSGYSTGFTLSSKITMTGALKIGGSSNSAGTMFGTSLPATGEFGQLYFLLS